MAILTSRAALEDPESDTQSGSLLHFHQRLGHLAYDTVERMARDFASGIVLTDRKRPTCISCAQGKQTMNLQSKTETGSNSPIDRVGGDKAAKKFEHFLAFFKRQFDCRIHVLRTDGGGDYANVDLYCKRTGVARQISEARNQASNGKAERMHRTILNMARSMIFASRLPLTFWGDAVEYAAYILNRSPTSANAKRASPIEVITKQEPNLRDIVAFGSICSVYRDPGKNSLAQRT
uniref:Integrase catalytic domain-containing protein n=1 Tax=Peronospora matthiolae TaxID=2874970 RepID=A0AAV1UND8_9STRA